jgi:hypothetical protein
MATTRGRSAQGGSVARAKGGLTAMLAVLAALAFEPALAGGPATGGAPCEGVGAAECVPAIEGPWRYAGGSPTHRIDVPDQPSLEEVRQALQDRTSALYGRNACSPARIGHAGGWRADTDEPTLQRERLITLYEVGFLHGDECTVVGGATTFHTTRQRSFSCEPGRTGPFLDSRGVRRCGPATPDRRDRAAISTR